MAYLWNIYKLIGENMLELFILVTASFSSFFAGNILGWSSAMKAVKREKEMEENLYKKFVDVYKDQQSYWEQDQELWNRDPEKQKLIDSNQIKENSSNKKSQSLDINRKAIDSLNE